MHDFCVIGGGIVGLSVAYNLIQRFPGCSLILLEKEDQLCRHQTGHNSGVIHSGVYYPPDSLKAKLCRAGEKSMKAFCQEHKIKVENCGKLLVATNEDEMVRMDHLAKRAQENSVEYEQLDAYELSKREPNIAGSGALFIPSTAIVDYKQVAQCLAEKITKSGGEIKLNSRISSITESAAHVEINDQSIIHKARQLIVCAGAQSDRMAKLSGMKPGYRIIPFRGEYFRLKPDKSNLISSLIYPIPDPALPFLGIHLTRTIDGNIIVGPNAVLGMAREKYPKGSIDVRDLMTMVSYPGFWLSLGKHLRSGISEISNSIFLSKYLKACQKYCPSLEKNDFTPIEAGIRAQAVRPDGSFVQDFLIKETARVIHVCNAPSPAATSSLPIGAEIANKVKAQRSLLS